LRLKWFGTAALLLEQDDTQLLFDPFISRNKKLFSPSLEELASAEHILLTHGHFDHIVDVPRIAEYNKYSSKIFCTDAPRKTLISKGVPSEVIHIITPGDELNLGPFHIRILRGKHIQFDNKLIVKTLTNPRMLRYFDQLQFLIKESRACQEAGEIVVYNIKVSNKNVLVIGSLNLDDKTEYPKEPDLLILPFQGNSSVSKIAMKFIEQLQPKRVLLDHFDDSFPPLTSSIKTESFATALRQKYPEISIVSAQASSVWLEIADPCFVSKT